MRANLHFYRNLNLNYFYLQKPLLAFSLISFYFPLKRILKYLVFLVFFLNLRLHRKKECKSYGWIFLVENITQKDPYCLLFFKLCSKRKSFNGICWKMLKSIYICVHFKPLAITRINNKKKRFALDIVYQEICNKLEYLHSLNNSYLDV